MTVGAIKMMTVLAKSDLFLKKYLMALYMQV